MCEFCFECYELLVKWSLKRLTLQKTADSKKILGRTRAVRIPRSFRRALFGRKGCILNEGVKDGDKRERGCVGSFLGSVVSSRTSDLKHRNHGKEELRKNESSS